MSPEVEELMRASMQAEEEDEDEGGDGEEASGDVDPCVEEHKGGGLGAAEPEVGGSSSGLTDEETRGVESALDFSRTAGVGGNEVPAEGTASGGNPMMRCCAFLGVGAVSGRGL